MMLHMTDVKSIQKVEKTIKFERQKKTKKKHPIWIKSTTMIKVQPTPLQLNKMVPTHTQTSLYFFGLVESVYGIISTNICYFFFSFFLFRFMFLLNESKKCEDPEIHQKHWEGQNWPTLVCCTSKQEYVIASFQIVPMFFCSCLNVV